MTALGIGEQIVFLAFIVMPAMIITVPLSAWLTNRFVDFIYRRISDRKN